MSHVFVSAHCSAADVSGQLEDASLLSLVLSPKERKRKRWEGGQNDLSRRVRTVLRQLLCIEELSLIHY